MGTRTSTTFATRRAKWKPAAVTSGAATITPSAEPCTARARAAAGRMAHAASSTASRSSVSTKSHEKNPIAVHGTRSFHGLPVSGTTHPFGRERKQAASTSTPHACTAGATGASRRTPM